MILKNSLLLAIFSALSLFLGIIRDRLLATHVGIGPVLDVYNASFRLPDLLYGAMLAFVTAGTVVPFLTEENVKGQILEPRRKLYSLTLFFAGVMSILILIIAITLPLLTQFIVPGFSDAQVSEFIFTTRILLIQPFFLGISSLISCFAQLRNEFIMYGLSPLGYSASIIASIVWLYPVYGLQGLIIGVVAGSFLSLLIQAYSLRNTNIFGLKYRFAYHHVKELVALSLPRTGTNLISQSRVIFFTGLATTIGPGGLSSYLFAQRVTDAVAQLIQQSITTASLPVLSKTFLEGRRKEYRDVFYKYISVLGVSGVVVALSLYLLQDIVIIALYGETAFNQTIAYFLNGFLLVLPLSMISGYLSISLYAMKDTKSVFRAFFFATLISVLVGFFSRSSGMASLRYAYVTWSIFQFLLLVTFYSRKKQSS